VGGAMGVVLCQCGADVLGEGGSGWMVCVCEEAFACRSGGGLWSEGGRKDGDMWGGGRRWVAGVQQLHEGVGGGGGRGYVGRAGGGGDGVDAV